MKFAHLSKEEEIKLEIKDTRQHLRDLDLELELLLTKEPNEVKYISSIRRHSNYLNEKLDRLYRELDR